MLTDLVKGRTATDVAALPKEELLEEIGIPLTPVRLKCAILGLGVLKVALHRAKGTPLPEEWQALADDSTSGSLAKIDVAPLEELPPGSMKLVDARAGRRSASTTAAAALRDRGPLLARRRAALPGRLGRGRVPRHLPAARRDVRPRDRPRRSRCRRIEPVAPSGRVEDGIVKVELP